MKEISERIKKIIQERPLIFQNDPAYHLTTLRKAPMMASTIYEIKKALANGIEPEKIKLASSVVYLMKDLQRRPLAIFKMGWHHESDPRKEIAAYLLDHDNFAMVPPVVSAHFHHPLFGGTKKGSCHLHMGDEEEGFCIDHKKRVYLSACSVRKIAALDIRVLNADRHFGNFIISKNHVFPIDHALILPSYRENVHVHFDWLTWDQAKTPFSDEEKRYIEALDPRKDAEMLQKEFAFSKSIAAMHMASSTLLKVGVKKGLNAYQIGKLVAAEGKQTHTPFSEALKNIAWNENVTWETHLKNVENQMERITAVEQK